MDENSVDSLFNIDALVAHLKLILVEKAGGNPICW